jgi:nucleoside-diphosphate-sugar epimerase
MKVFVAGATGALGKQLVPRLVSRGHEVVGMTRTPSKTDLLRSLGARPVVADALDPDAVGRAVSEAEPDVIVHQLTALSSIDFRHIERDFALTDRLRTEGTDHLLSAGQAVGVRRFVAQSYAGWPFAAAVARSRPRTTRWTAATWTEGIVLRYGGFYGPGTGLTTSPLGDQAELLRRRKFPLVGDGGGVWSFVHIVDAAAATVAAIEHGTRGIYNVVDDEPAPVAEWLPAAAAAVGAKPPRRVPRWIGRLLAGEAATVMMTEVRGAPHTKAKRELGWSLRYPSWRQGFANGLG